MENWIRKGLSAQATGPRKALEFRLLESTFGKAQPSESLANSETVLEQPQLDLHVQIETARNECAAHQRRNEQLQQDLRRSTEELQQAYLSRIAQLNQPKSAATELRPVQERLNALLGRQDAPSVDSLFAGFAALQDTLQALDTQVTTLKRVNTQLLAELKASDARPSSHRLQHSKSRSIHQKATRLF